MAIAKMSHIRLIGLRRDQNKILDALTARGLFEARATDRVAFDLEKGGSARFGELKLKQAKLAFALDFLCARHTEMASALAGEAKRKDGTADPALDFTLSKEKYGSGRMLITHADFSDAAAKEFDLLHVCDELEKISFAIVECKARMSELRAAVAAYEPYAAVPVALSAQERGGDIAIYIYHSKSGAEAGLALDMLMCAYDTITTASGTAVVVVSKRAVADEAAKSLGALGYVRCPFVDDCTAAQKIDALSGELSDVNRQVIELTKSALAYEKYVGELRILYDVFEADVERAEAEELFLKSDSTFVLEGWLPESVAEQTVAEVGEMCPSTFVQLLAPEERDAPPTLLVNKEIIKPYEDVTNMYTAPKYGEIDPNPIMSVFYFLFFGIMVGDAVYGLALAVLGFIFGRSARFDTGAKRLLILVAWGGVSAVIWGVLFGGYVSIEFGTKVALWFNPMDEPLTLLILSIVAGCVQLVTAYIIKLVAQCMDGDPLSGILDQGPIILIFGAAACLGLKMALAHPPAGLTTAAIVLGATAAGVMLIFGGRKKKGIGKLLGGFGEIYGLINLVSDVLSYCRLFGLCLASAAIGLAFNTLGAIIFGIPVIGYPIGIILLIPLHAFNLALGVLSAYVHDARLQYLEFYGKFYSGGGRLFAPLGNRRKYTRFA